MEIKVNKIHLTGESSQEQQYDPKNDSTDVLVFLNNGKKCIASFFTYANIREMKLQHEKNGDFLKGSYFWDKNMVLVEDCSLTTIELVVRDLIDEGNFQEAFREL